MPCYYRRPLLPRLGSLRPAEEPRYREQVTLQGLEPLWLEAAWRCSAPLHSELQHLPELDRTHGTRMLIESFVKETQSSPCGALVRHTVTLTGPAFRTRLATAPPQSSPLPGPGYLTARPSSAPRAGQHEKARAPAQWQPGRRELPWSGRLPVGTRSHQATTWNRTR